MLLLTWLKVTSASKKSCCFYWLGLVESVIADWMKNLTCCFLIGHQNPKPANPQRMSLTTDKKVLFTYLYPFQNCSRIFPHPPPHSFLPPPLSVRFPLSLSTQGGGREVGPLTAYALPTPHPFYLIFKYYPSSVTPIENE